jgi:hypothetical protein
MHHSGGMKKEEKPVRGVFERPAGSGCWWINYYVGVDNTAKKWAGSLMPSLYTRKEKLMHGEVSSCRNWCQGKL